MAEDKLIFPIGFDLEPAVKKASQDWDGKYAALLEKNIQKRAIEIRLKLNTKNLDSLDAVKQRLAELKIEPITPETKAAIKELAAELRVLAKALEQVQKYSAGKSAVSPDAVRAARISEINQRKAEKAAIALERQKEAAAKVAAAEERLAMVRIRSSQMTARAAQGVNSLTNAYKTQSTYLDRLLTRMVAYWSVQQVQQFITSVREVTAEFELQRVSLGAIIQDQQRANQLFSEIKSFAVTSPLSILDLTKYTKQVAAYRIETDKLFDTTKRLADVSVGLGVDMGRLVLAYGQVKAASYLRASEIRQFTEAGIPMLELLAEKFTQLQGRAISTAQVMDLVSKGAVSFSMVEDIFKDMTDAGGMFYNMQEKQAQTLFGMWSKLGDAASIMYEEIGNTGWVNAGMKGAIGLLEDMMHGWRNVAAGIFLAGSSFVVFKAGSAILKLIQANSIAAAAATRQYARAQEQLNAAKMQGSKFSKNIAALRARAAAANRAAASSTNLWTAANYKLKASLLSLRAASGDWVGLALAAIAAFVTYLVRANQEAKRLNKELSKMSAEGASKADEMARNFERLAKIVVESADGSKQQNDALKELKRTYSDVIPAQDLTIDKLREMKGAYDSVTQAIREKIYQQTLEQQLSAIQEKYSSEISEGVEDTRESLEKHYGLSPTEAGRVIGAIRKAIDDGLLTVGDDIKTRMAIISKIIKDETGKTIQTFNDIPQYRRNGEIRYWRRETPQFVELSKAVTDIVKPMVEMNDKLREQEEFMAGSTQSTGRYTNVLKEAKQSIQAFSSVLPSSSYGYKLEEQQYKIKQYAIAVRNLFKEAAKALPAAAKINIDDFFVGDDINWDAATAAAKKTSFQFKTALSALKEAYDEAIPSDNYVALVTNIWEEVSKKTGISMNVLQRHLKTADKSMSDYAEGLQKALKAAQKEYDDMIRYNEQAEAIGLTPFSPERIKESKDQITALTEVLKLLSPYLEPKSSSGGRQSDPRLQTLQEIANKMAEVNKEYDELLKKEGQTKALADTQKLFAASFKQMQSVADKYGFTLPAFEVPQTTEDVQKWYKAVMDNIKRLNLKNADKVLIELGFKSDKLAIDKQQKDIENRIKQLADRISRTKAAKEFYDKILGQTGDIQLATKITFSVYGQNGEALKDELLEQIRAAFTSGKDDVKIDLSYAVDEVTGAIDYNKLAELDKKYRDVLIGEHAELRKKLIEEGRKTSEAQAQQWLKDIEKAKDYAQQRIDLAAYTANQIAEINARADLDQGTKDTLIKGYQDREAQQLAKLQYDEFKDSAMYVHIFEDLDNASTTALKNMRDRLIALKDQWKNLDPTQVKELAKAIANIDAQIAGRNPFKTLVDGFKELMKARPQKLIDADLIAATAELENREKALTAATQKYTAAQTAQLAAEAEVTEARKNLALALEMSGGEETPEVEAAREVLRLKAEGYEIVKAVSKETISSAKEEVDAAAGKYNDQKKVVDNIEAENNARKGTIDKINEAIQKIDEYQALINEALDGVRKMMEAFGASDEDMQFFDDVVGGLNEITNAGKQAVASAASFMSGRILEGITGGISAIGSLVSGITNIFSAGRVRRANKEIKRQQKLLEQLEYAYSRLEDSADKLFGTDYINNYNSQVKNLESQRNAYLKQAQAERSKGKKADKDKIKEYENQARDTADKLKDMHDDLVNHFTGTDRASTAKDFAQAWLEAKASFTNTADAIKSKYKDLIRNMIIEGAAAKVFDNILGPMWDKMSELLGKNPNDPTIAVNYVVTAMDDFTEQADHAMKVLYESLKAKGIDMKDIFGDYDEGLTGISRDIATASEESINGLAAGINTQNYYISHVPTISENVMYIRQLMENEYTPFIMGNSNSIDRETWQKEAFDRFAAMERYMSESVIECRRAANACEEQVAQLRRVIVPKGSRGSHGVQVYMQN